MTLSSATLPSAADFDLEVREQRRALVRTRWRFTLLPLAVMAALMAVFAPAAVWWGLDYTSVVPLFLAIGGIVVLFVGAWYDFGAKGYVKGLLRANVPVTQEDIDRIHREQLILTLCYGGVAGLYVVMAIVVSML